MSLNISSNLLVLFSAGNVKNETTKVLKHAKSQQYQWLRDILKQLKIAVSVTFCALL